MSKEVQKYEQTQIENLTKIKEIPDFRTGDTVRVSIKVFDGTTERLQKYEGLVISRRNRGLTSSFVVRKISRGEGVERRFLIYSPILTKIELIKHGIVRRAKLYYLRNLRGKAARIPERKNYVNKVNYNT